MYAYILIFCIICYIVDTLLLHFCSPSGPPRLLGQAAWPDAQVVPSFRGSTKIARRCRVSLRARAGPRKPGPNSTNFDKFRFGGFYLILIKFGILGWVRNGIDITNVFVNCEVHFF